MDERWMGWMEGVGEGWNAGTGWMMDDSGWMNMQEGNGALKGDTYV